MLIFLAIVILGALLFYFVIKANNRYWDKQKVFWEPHCKAFNGRIVKRYRWSGEFDGVPVFWRVYSSGGGGGENTSQELYYFELFLQFPRGGRKWKVHYNVPGLLNHRPEGWTITTKDSGLENALTEAGIKTLAATQPRYFSARYNDKNGRLVCEFQVNGMGYVQPLDEFTQTIHVLAQMGKINEDVKSAHR